MIPICAIAGITVSMKNTSLISCVTGRSLRNTTAVAGTMINRIRTATTISFPILIDDVSMFRITLPINTSANGDVTPLIMDSGFRIKSGTSILKKTAAIPRNIPTTVGQNRFLIFCAHLALLPFFSPRCSRLIPSVQKRTVLAI